MLAILTTFTPRKQRYSTRKMVMK